MVELGWIWQFVPIGHSEFERVDMMIKVGDQWYCPILISMCLSYIPDKVPFRRFLRWLRRSTCSLALSRSLSPGQICSTASGCPPRSSSRPPRGASCPPKTFSTSAGSSSPSPSEPPPPTPSSPSPCWTPHAACSSLPAKSTFYISYRRWFEVRLGAARLLADSFSEIRHAGESGKIFGHFI